MDPAIAIVKLLEEDEDETMHSGADVEALQAALNRDIEGHDDTSTSHPFDSNTGRNQTDIQDQDGKTINLHGQQGVQSAVQLEQNLPELEQGPLVSVLEGLRERPNDVPGELKCIPTQQKRSQGGEQISGQDSQTTEMQTSGGNATLACESNGVSQCLESKKMDNRQTGGRKQVSLAVLMPVLMSQLDTDKAMQLRTLYDKMKRHEITKEAFVRHMSSIVGNEKLKLATNKLYSQAPAQQNNTRTPSLTAGVPQFSGPQSFTELQKSTSIGGSTKAMNMMSGGNLERQNSMNHPPRLNGGSLGHTSRNPIPCQFSTSKELKQQSASSDAEVQHKLHLSSPHGLSGAQFVQRNVIPAISKDNNSIPLSLSSQLDHNVPLGSKSPPLASPACANAKIPQQQASVGQKKPLEDLGSSRPLPSKRQKVTGAFSDQSIDQLNDVAAVSGVNLQEEEERLLSGPKDDSRVSEASRRIMREEERGILLKAPLQKKLAEIMAKRGLKNISNDVERCLSLSVEERMRGLICNLIRLSKQRADAGKPKHLKLITSDVRQQIIRLNCQAKEEWEKKQADLEKLQNVDEMQPEGSGVDGENQKNEGQVKSVKKNKVDDEKLGASAANIAARAAFGGDDKWSKWQLMAEQARQKRERGLDSASSSQASNRSTKENQEAEKKSPPNPITSGSVRKVGQNQVMAARTIALKDVIAVLQREPQMSRSTLIYRLYERTRSMAAA